MLLCPALFSATPKTGCGAFTKCLRVFCSKSLRKTTGRTACSNAGLSLSESRHQVVSVENSPSVQQSGPVPETPPYTRNLRIDHHFSNPQACCSTLMIGPSRYHYSP